MLEIPESQTLARQLRETIIGRRVEQVQAAQTPHGFAWYLGDPAAYPALLVGQTVTDAYALAGQVEICLGQARLVFNDGVNVRFLPPEQVPGPKHQLYIRFSDGGQIVCTVQMYGAMMAFLAGTYDNHYYRVAAEKPNPLCAEFDEAYFGGLLAGAPTKLSVKALLATEQRIPGLGNGCLQDILFRARLNPQTKIKALSDPQLAGLFASLKKTLQMMTDGNGRDTEKDLFGQPGGYSTLLSAKTYKNPCPLCGGAITRKAYLGGNVYFCPNCQS